MSKLAQETGLGRESLYKSLSDQGNPEIKTLLTILQTLGIQMTFLPVTQTAKQG
jgi:probable addiction module antidote protein